MRRFRFYSIPLLLILVLWGQTALYTVDQAEFVYVTRFGEPVAVHDGASAAGLHLKWPAPIESVRRLDRRLQSIDLPAIEALTRDTNERDVGKTLAVDAFVCWRIPDAVAADRFLRTVGTVEQARRLLTPRINGRLTALVGNVPLQELFGLATDAAIEARAESARRKLLGVERIGPNDTDEPLADAVLRDYGIQLVDVRLRRLNYPESALPSIVESIKEQRNEKVIRIETVGQQAYTKIVEDAKLKAAEIEKRAATERKIISEQADRKAAEIRLAAYAIDEKFSIFWKKLKTYQDAWSRTGDALLLSGKHPLFDLMLRPPQELNGPKPNN
jgi:membrane protease subunit HflC